MLSSGIFLLPGLAFEKTGPSVILSYFIAGLFATAGMLSQAELATAMPKSGGTYYYVTRSMGTSVGTVYGLITMLALSLKSAFELIAMAAFAKYMINIDVRIIAVSLCFFFILINLVGAKGAGRLQAIMVFFILPVLLAYFFFGISFIHVYNFENFALKGVMPIFSTAGFVFVSYGGLLKIASIAEEIKNPGKTLPLGMILSLLVIIIVYMLVLFVTVGVMEPDKLSVSLRPLTDSSEIIFGPIGVIFLTIAAMFGFSSAANASILGASRYPLALSRDNLLPGALGNVNSRFNSPHNAILLTGLMIIIALFLDLDTIIKLASSVLIMTYIFSCLANIIMRESHLQNYRPSFKAPLYPYVQIFGILGFSFLLYEIGYKALIASFILVVLGFLIYWFFGRIKAQKEYALLHLIERITSKDLTNHSLESELKEVLRERDDIIKDKFDTLVEKSIILDIENDISKEDFFKEVSDLMSSNLNIDSKKLYKLLIRRESESSTALGPKFAIPHIVIPGKKVFNILIARSKKGIYFSKVSPNVNAIFLLVGTKDERNFHLRALSAIAQIVHNSHFDKMWVRAKNKEAIRDIVLLGKRRR